MKQSTKQRTKPSYPKLVQGFVGFLTGTGKSLSTIGSYRGDLGLFESFLKERKKDFYALSEKDFSTYQIWLEAQGLKTNTRRRKILSAKALVRYAVSRKKMPATKIQFVKAPDRLERLPWIPLPADWKKVSSYLSEKTPLGLRNLVAAHLLVETGMTVAELCSLRWEQISKGKVNLEGKRPRAIPLSAELTQWLNDWRKLNKGKHLFPGFNRHGPTSERMSSRGVELFFRSLGKTSGYPSLKPKTLRHLAIANWLRENLAETEIQRRLGVHPNYSLDAYRKHLETC
jgi:integrase/recombinase XerD